MVPRCSDVGQGGDGFGLDRQAGGEGEDGEDGEEGLSGEHCVDEG
jgi:hypothetical protein